MNKSQRIYFDTTKAGVDMNIKVRLEQDIDTLEFMSMQLSTEEIYQDFNSDYGVLVGKVTANGGVGIPNAKISIFIPLTDADADMGQITSIYPYKTPRDKNFEGKRYNLLPRVSKIDPNTNQLTPKQAFGSFPIKEEVVTNTLIMDVYKKYYKYTALTNNSGDYMIFGVPTGTQTVHMSVDITDIGKYSMNPASMVTNLGYSPNLFTDNNTKIKPSADLGDLPNIETQEITVDVIPFWGDTTNFDIGITRQDFRIRATLVNTFTIFGSVFTDGANNMWGGNRENKSNVSELYRSYDAINDDTWATIGISSRRIGKVTEKIYYYPPNITDKDINEGKVDPDGADMRILDPSEYTIHKRDGDFVFIINCNRNKITKDENNNTIHLDNNSPDGVFTEFRGFITLEITPNDLPMNFVGWIGDGGDTHLTPYRYKLKFPQHASSGDGFGYLSSETPNADMKTIEWRKQNYIFSAGKFYSFSRHHGLTENSMPDGQTDKENNKSQTLNDDKFLEPDKLNMINYGGINIFKNVGIISTNTTPNSNNYPNGTYEFPSNASRDGVDYFGSNWLNLSVYLPQAGYADNGYAYIDYIYTNDNFSVQAMNTTESELNGYYLSDNLQKIAAGDFNTKGFARSDLHWTDFIEVPLTDINRMHEMHAKGFIFNPETQNTFTGQYRNGKYAPQGWEGACPVVGGEALSNGGRLNADPESDPDPKVYFYKGLGEADCIQFLFELGLIN